MSKKVIDPDEAFMRIALREARKGMGRTSPNPCVGAVVVRDGEIMARGWHARAGGPHAEVVALNKAGEKARKSSIYVTLEPCNHTGRTPPCTRAIVTSGVSRVVIGMIDPNPLVSGHGSAYLTSKGILVRTDVLEYECRRLNLPFEKMITTGQPYVVLKAGVTMDGRIAPGNGKSGWITGEPSRREVHRMRDRLDAILVGSSTAVTDDPSLTVRLVGQKSRDPLRLVLDTNLCLSPRARMLTGKSGAKTWIFSGPDPDEDRVRGLEKAGARVIPGKIDAEGHVDIPTVMQYVAAGGINSVLVEGGGQVHAAFLRQDLIDRVNLFFAPFFLGGGGVPLIGDLGPAFPDGCQRFRIQRSWRFGEDLMVEMVRKKG